MNVENIHDIQFHHMKIYEYINLPLTDEANHNNIALMIPTEQKR